MRLGLNVVFGHAETHRYTLSSRVGGINERIELRNSMRSVLFPGQDNGIRVKMRMVDPEG